MTNKNISIANLFFINYNQSKDIKDVIIINNMDNLPIAIESAVELWLNNEHITTFLCSPYNLEILGIGHLLTRGVISNVEKIIDISVDYENLKINVFTSELIKAEEQFSVPKFILSGVSSINNFNDNIYKINKVRNDISFDLNLIHETAKYMVDNAPLYKETGGVHAAIIKDSENNFSLKEDIGRHCAVDKAVGDFLMNNYDLSNCFIATTGRISLDMLLKSAVMGIPVVVSLKRPSSLAIELANFYGICIVARILSSQPLIYTNNDKILISKE